ncbi:trypco2 family protein [Nostoc sp. 106C]|uniref:trypco2 family protein n=1 Tax=Nostoc sp. 106C TaxID=1932667 RepID=UPI000A3C7A64|nr:trypco2 family protein [Nostoc sp. 106C]OUL28508.1 hypothetical protein BV375_17550 [Nostoc sp. 106C]
MAEENGIGLAELIQQVKQELLSNPADKETSVPFLSVDSVELELQVAVQKEAKGKIKIYVLEVGGGSSRSDVQKIKVTLSPMFDKKALLDFYKTLHSDRVPGTVKKSLDALFKGDDGNADEGVM